MKKKYLYGFLFTLITTIVVFILVSGINGFIKNINSFFGYNYIYFIISIIIMIIKWLIESLIIKVLLKEISYKSAINFTLIGQFYSYLTPFYTGGQPFQIIYLSKYGIDPGEATAVILFKTFIFQINMAFLGAVGIFYSLFNYNKSITIGIILGTFMNSLAIFLILFYVINENAAINTTMYFIRILKKIGVLKEPEKYTNEIILKIEKFIEIFKKESKKIIKILILFILSFLQFSTSFLVLPFVMKGFGLNMNLNIIIRSLITQITSSIVPTPGTSGGAEGIFYLLFSNIIPSEKIGAAIILWRFSIYYFVLLVGGIVVLYNHKRKKV
ncbi:lysylphosphatidylglycerol synthase transmembrane domain-containing protein [Marinitoga sp. 38H-ov]|uniref:lysylphosphatidylglycerol synthase transmembrane domain-containing protein n=1 Tax=Marinitoga sp. 38H-ov TaxID=1755814 RepID=UPI0013EBC90D|nr:lysylphosphatidylglycerol synthase transmembrane domain-containing protein [Marinitoga sp. 38H-ov]KAF2956677.1 hypothetical protein AS160_04625 [Marinitoga sp. 38H-ov]